MSSRARRPYLMGSESVGDFYKSDVRFLKEIVGRESEFEKPYGDEDYRKMHFDFPWPDWPPFPDLPPMPDIPPGPVPGLSLCGIVCYEPLSDCDEPIWCHPGIWCGYDPNCNLCSWIVEGATTGYTWKRTINDDPIKTYGIEIWIDTNLLTDGKALIHVQMKDPCGNLCGEDLEVTCKECPPDVSISWDSDVNLVIGQGNGGYATVGVSVKDGLGPYTWKVTGTGFSMLYEETAGVDNTLQADATACGMATIKVTDDCDEDCTGKVRCTADSSWVSQGIALGAYDGGITWCYGAGFGFGSTELIVGEERWTFITGSNCMTAAPNDSWNVNSGTYETPPCGGPFDCAPTQGVACNGTNPVGCSGYFQIFSSSYFKWECN